MRVSVVISTFEREAVLGRVLDLLERQTAGTDAFEVVVAVNAAQTDVSGVEAAAARRPYATRVVQGESVGVSASRNRGWREARGDVVLFMGDDMLPAADLVERHLAAHAAQPEVDVGVLGHVRWARELERTPFRDWLDRGMQFDFASIRGTEAAWWHFYACNLSLKRAALERVGGYDEEFRWGYEDLDLGLRLHGELGWRLVYDAAAEVEHLHPPSLEAWRERMRTVAGAERQFLAKHPSATPYFLQRFERAAALPPSKGRGVQLARWVPEATPWLGPRVHHSTDRYFAQQLAPTFLEAWRAAEGPYAHLNPAKLRAIDACFGELGCETFADLGGIWEVDGGYARYAADVCGGRGVVVDDDFTDAFLAHGLPGLGHVRGNFGDPDVIAGLDPFDVAFFFDVLLHQVDPDWDELLEAYAAKCRVMAIVQPQWNDAETIRLFDLGEPAYMAAVPAAGAPYEGLFDRLDEVNPRRGRLWRDVHDVWQWGISDEDLIARMDELGFALRHREDTGPWRGLDRFHESAFVFAR